MYSKSFNGEVNRFEMAEAGFGSARMAALPQQPLHARGLDHPGEGDAPLDPQPLSQRFHTREIRLGRVPADDESPDARHERERLEQHVDPLPRIQVPGVGHDRLSSRASRSRLPASRFLLPASRSRRRASRSRASRFPLPASRLSLPAPCFPLPASRLSLPAPCFPLPAPKSPSRVPNPESRIPNPESRIPSPESRIPNPESRAPNPESRIPNPESRIPNPESRIPNPESRDSRIPSPQPPIPSPIRNHAEAFAVGKPRCEVRSQRCRDCDVPVGFPPDPLFTVCESSELTPSRRVGGSHELRQGGGDIRRITVRLVHDWRAQRTGKSEQQRRHAEIAREHHVGPSGSGGASGGERKISKPPRGGRTTDRRSLDPEPVERRQPVVVERIARRSVRVGPDDELHMVAQLPQRIARLHRLDPIRALQRKANVGEVENTQRAGRHCRSCRSAAGGL